MLPENQHPGHTEHPMSTGFEGNRYTELAKRDEALGTKTVDSFVMTVTGEWFNGHNKPHMFLTHPEEPDKVAYLQSVSAEIAQGMGTDVPPRPFNTVTLTYSAGEAKYRVLVGSAGRRIDTNVKRQIALDLKRSGIDISPKQAKGAAINAQDGWDPADALGLEPGVVGPLLSEVSDDVSAYYLLGEKVDPDGPITPIELALSPIDSLIMDHRDLEEMLPAAHEAFVRKPDFFRIIPPPETETTPQPDEPAQA